MTNAGSNCNNSRWQLGLTAETANARAKKQPSRKRFRWKSFQLFQLSQSDPSPVVAPQMNIQRFLIDIRMTARCLIYGNRARARQCCVRSKPPQRMITDTNDDNRSDSNDPFGAGLWPKHSYRHHLRTNVSTFDRQRFDEWKIHQKSASVQFAQKQLIKPAQNDF